MLEGKGKGGRAKRKGKRAEEGCSWLGWLGKDGGGLGWEGGGGWEIRGVVNGG